jgi:hypothetical protein
MHTPNEHSLPRLTDSAEPSSSTITGEEGRNWICGNDYRVNHEKCAFAYSSFGVRKAVDEFCKVSGLSESVPHLANDGYHGVMLYDCL